MKTILYVDPTSVHGGAEEVLVRFMSGAREIGYQPVLVVPSEGWLTERCRDLDIPYEIAPSIPDATSVHTFSQQLKPWLTASRQIARAIRKWQPVIVHANSPRVSYHAGLGARFAGGVATVTHVHDIGGIPFLSPRKAKLLGYLGDWFLTPSNAVTNVIVEAAPQFRSRVQTVYNGWDMDVYAGVQPADLTAEFGVPRDALVIGTAAAMTPWKGQDVLVEAFRALKTRHPRAHLLIVGAAYGANQEQAAYEARLRQQVAASGVADSITFTGWREDVWSLMRSFDIFVHVPKEPDPLPTAVIHASALGCAIVGTRIGGIPEIVPENTGGLIVEPGDWRMLASALDWLAAEPARRSALGQGAHAHFLARFSRRQMLDGLASAYAQTLAYKGRAQDAAQQPVAAGPHAR